MNFNESIELVFPFRSEDQESLSLLLHSLQLTCSQNDIYVSLVDINNVIPSLKQSGCRLFESSRINVVSQPPNPGFSSALEQGFTQAQELRPDPWFIGFGHCDWVGVASGWLDTALELLLEPQVGAVGFDPGGKIYAGDNLAEYADDWLVLTKREVISKILPFPKNLQTFGWAPWFHMALALQGWEERIIKSSDGNPLVAHSRKNGRIMGGRRSDEQAQAEIEQLKIEIQKLARV